MSAREWSHCAGRDQCLNCGQSFDPEATDCNGDDDPVCCSASCDAEYRWGELECRAELARD